MASTTYLQWQNITAGNRNTWTMSMWVKTSVNNDEQPLFSSALDSNNQDMVFIEAGGNLRWWTYQSSSYAGQLRTSRLLRDANAWYHLVFVFDSTNSTADDRMRIYINGVQETSFTARVNPSQNTNSLWNGTLWRNIGHDSSGVYTDEFDGSMSHIHFIDGTAYDASYFGETDANGVWKINTSPSVTYGTNGFFILKDGNSVTDQSGNGNNFTVGGGTLTKTEDSPSNVFATLNPLMGGLSNVTYSNGNTTATFGAPSTWYFTPSTLAASQGKWYAEVKVGAVGTETSIGIIPMETVSLQQGAASDYMGKESDSIGYVNNGQLYKTNSVQETTSTYTTGDIIGMAFDLDGNSIQFYKNGSSVGSAISLTSGLNYTVGVSGYNSSSSNVNFGNGYFGTTAVSSAENPDDGIGIFEYAVPTGYKALCTKSINAQEYD